MHSDAEAIERSLLTPDKFAPIFERHWDAMYRYFERRVGSTAAEDLASELFRVAFERRGSYATGASESCRPWLYGIAAICLAKRRCSFMVIFAAMP